MARSPDIVARLGAAVTLTPREFVDQYLFTVVPYAFRLAPIEYEEFRTELAIRLGVALDQIILVGSGRLGFSLNPDHLLRSFSKASDLDVVIV